jgi:hypothetical protein
LMKPVMESILFVDRDRAETETLTNLSRAETAVSKTPSLDETRPSTGLHTVARRQQSTGKMHAVPYVLLMPRAHKTISADFKEPGLKLIQACGSRVEVVLDR